MANSKTPATTDTVNGTVIQSELIDKFHAYMLDRAQQSDDSDRGREIMDQQAERILMAETEDEIMRADTSGAVQCRDVPGTMWEIRGFTVNVSTKPDIENSKGYYITMDAVCLGALDESTLTRWELSVGQAVPLQTGALLLTSKIRKLEAEGALPKRLMLEGTRTANDFTVLKWVNMPKMAVAQ